MDCQANLNGKHASAIDELTGAVERIDEPAALAPMLRPVGRLLGEDAVGRKCAPKTVDQQFVRAAVSLGHRPMVVGLLLDIEGGAVHFEHESTGLARELGGRLELSREKHRP
jgi:hypothetical protein